MRRVFLTMMNLMIISDTNYLPHALSSANRNNYFIFSMLTKPHFSCIIISKVRIIQFSNILKMRIIVFYTHFKVAHKALAEV